ncbi:hypothetical protein [Companilactobacillus furfuricola]|uniref:hypothetical protein n=1 Tax=Companilactobacillus furfuricola TaxID=1462575 RepID=UPI000F7ABA12|nr:hypothetical protein [Companilactobacillus furfuricola]
MLTTKTFNVFKGIDQNATFMSPYLGLKLGLCDAVCLSGEQFQQEERFLNEQIAPIYHSLIPELENRDLAKILNDLPVSMINHIVSARTPEGLAILTRHLNKFAQDLPFHPTNSIHLALDVLSGQDQDIATDFYSYIETTAEPIAEFYRYTCIGNTSYYALNLKDALTDIKQTYQRQCRQIKLISKNINIDPHELTKFSILIEKIIVNKQQQISKVDISNSFTITPIDLI